jgi:hypothetical protein
MRTLLPDRWTMNDTPLVDSRCCWNDEAKRGFDGKA